MAQQGTPDPFDIRSHVPSTTKIGVVNADGSVTNEKSDDEKVAAHQARSNSAVAAGAVFILITGYFFYRRTRVGPQADS